LLLTDLFFSIRTDPDILQVRSQSPHSRSLSPPPENGNSGRPTSPSNRSVSGKPITFSSSLDLEDVKARITLLILGVMDKNAPEPCFYFYSIF
jgi:hypothetical protein